MKYEYAIRDYDRSPEGNIPKKHDFEADSDLQAMCYVFDYVDPDEAADDDELMDILVEEGWFKKKCSSKEAIKWFCDRENRNIDPSDAFIFYVKNKSTGKMVYENDYCDIDDWTESLEGNVDEFKNELIVKMHKLVGFPLTIYFIDEVIKLKKAWWGDEGTYEDFLYEEGDNFDDPILQLVFYAFYEDSVEVAFDEMGIESIEDLEDMVKKIKKEVPAFEMEEDWKEIIGE